MAKSEKRRFGCGHRASSIAKRGREAGSVRGMVHVTRHPVLMGLAGLSLVHLLPIGAASDLAFWGTNFVVAVVGALHQDHRLRQVRPGYAAYMEKTTVFPNPLGILRIGPVAAAAFVAGGLLAVAPR